jgi:hypothetical protein
MGIVAQHNPMRAKIILKLAAGKLTVEKAAKVAQVPISGVLGWMKMAGIPIPMKHQNRRNRLPPASPPAD